MQATASRLVLSPSDLNDYVECAHLTTLALEVARGVRRRPHVPNDHGDLLRRKGEEHEAAYLAGLRAAGRQVVDVIGADRWDFETAARATVDAMRAGAQIIYQATFVLGDWRGRADFLERIEQKTALGPWGYEALDAKRRGRAAQPRVPLLAQPPQRRRLARDVPGLRRRQPPPARVPRTDHRADALGERALSIRGDRRSPNRPAQLR
jgi:uncharacterized protein